MVFNRRHDSNMWCVAIPVHDWPQIHNSWQARNIVDMRAPELVRAGDIQIIRADTERPWWGCGMLVWGLMHRFDSHQPHQSANPMASHTIASTAQMPRPSAGIRRLKALFVNPAYERRTQWALLFALVKPVRTVD